MNIKIENGKVMLYYEESPDGEPFEVDKLATVATGEYYLFLKNSDGTEWGKLEVDAETYDAVGRALIEACGELLATL